MAAPVPTLNQTEIAALFRKSTRTIRNWQKSGMPHRMIDGEPRYVVADCMEWREERVREEERAESAPDEAKERARAVRAQADLRELELAERRGQMVPVAQYQERLDAFVGGFAATAAGRLQRFEREIVRAGDAATARLVTQKIHAALMEGAQSYADELEEEMSALSSDEEAA